MRGQTRLGAVVAVGAAVLAFAVRMVGADRMFQDGVPQVAPFDELYHWKRITYSAANFPYVLEFDPSRGLRGSFCPWPPLYDLGAGAVAMLAGATEAYDVLRVIVWIPPVLTSILIGAAIAIIARSAPVAAAIVAVPLATNPFLVYASTIADIDHHFLEPFLVLAILGGTILVMRPGAPRERVVAGATLGAAITVALFVQTALIVAAGLAFICLYVSRRFDAYAPAIAAFVMAGMAVMSYRLTRPPAFPDGPWFLGFTHAALLFGAAAAIATLFFLDRCGSRSAAAAAAGLIVGMLIVATIPGTADSFVGGLRFFRGDAWLASIDEFQPVWTPLSRLPSYAAGLSIGALSAMILLVRAARSRSSELAVAIFAIAYIAMTIPNRRFSVISTVLAAVAAAVFAKTMWEQPKRRWFAIVIMALTFAVPPVQLILWWAYAPPVGLRGEPLHFLRSANFLRDRPEGGVLAPWSYGHMFNVIGQRHVVLDNFGTMADQEAFRAAHATMLRTDEGEAAAFCKRIGVRYVVLETPLRGTIRYARYLGLPEESFVRDDRPTRYSQAMWYWRAWFNAPLTHFRRIYADDTVVVLEKR